MKYPLGIQTFENLRRGGYIYVDKTDLVHKLTHSGQNFFLSRPRRFGKSLLLSTIEAYFQGKRELFDGLALEKLESRWEVYPVIHIDLNSGLYDSLENMRGYIISQLSKFEDKYGIVNKEPLLSDRFAKVIEKAQESTGRHVVVLIDEYDKPLLEAIGKDRLLEVFRNELRSLYGVLKSNDRYLRFVMLTGVSKFGQFSVFSDLNNITDISFADTYATICGITHGELESVFGSEIDTLADKYKCDRCEMIRRLRNLYDGYRFSDADTKVFNPYSILSAFFRNKLGAYWFATGTPKYLASMLKARHYEPWHLEGAMASESTLSMMDTDSSDPLPVIYQSGYITIKGYDEAGDLYTLGFPNEEVRKGFMEYLLPYYLKDEKQTSFDIAKFKTDVRTGDAHALMERLRSLTADISYNILANCEADFQNMLYIIFTISSLKPIVERDTSDGRIDMVVETEHYIYILEFKIDGSAQAAIDQIEEKGYALPWSTDHRKVIRIGANFSTKHRRLTDFIIT